MRRSAWPLLIAFLCLVGCGQKGRLVKPGPPPATQSATNPAPPPAPAKP